MFGGMDPNTAMWAILATTNRKYAPLASLMAASSQQKFKASQAQELTQGFGEVDTLIQQGQFDQADARLNELTGKAYPGTEGLFTAARTQFGKQKQQHQLRQHALKFNQVMNSPDVDPASRQQAQSAFLEGALGLTGDLSGLAGIMGNIAPKHQIQFDPKTGTGVAINPSTLGINQLTTQPNISEDTYKPYNDYLLKNHGITSGQFANLVTQSQSNPAIKALVDPINKQLFKGQQGLDLSTKQGEAEIQAGKEKSVHSFRESFIPPVGTRAEQVQHASRIAEAQEAARRNAEIAIQEGRPLTDKEALNLVDTQSFQNPRPGEKISEARKGNYIFMAEGEQRDYRDLLSNTKVLLSSVREMRDVIKKNPDLFPTTPDGSLPKAAQQAVKLYFDNKLGEINPKYREAFAKMKAIETQRANFARAGGDTANIAIPEGELQAQGLGLQPGFAEANLTKLDTVEKLLGGKVNDKFSQRGLTAPLTLESQGDKPSMRTKEITLKNGKKVLIEVTD